MSHSLRTFILCALIVLLNAADLYLTIFHAQNFGFLEANPIARFIAEASVWWLVAYKIVMVTIGCSILLFVHKRRALLAAIISWLMVLIFSSLLIYWAIYTREVVIVAEQGHHDEAVINKAIEKANSDKYLKFKGSPSRDQ